MTVGSFASRASLQIPSEYADFDGEVLAVQPPSLLEFRWGSDFIRLQVAPDPEGSVLTLIDRIDQRGKAARDAAGWDDCLERLAHHLAGTSPEAPGERWKAVHPSYVEKFGPEAATIGVPEQVR